MKLITTTPPSVEPVSLLEVKLHLRLAVDETSATAYNQEDDLLNALIKTAREKVEQYTGRALLTQTKKMYLDRWPDGNSKAIPYPPLQTVTSVKYRPVDSEAYTTFTDYEADIVSVPGRIVLKPNASWPSDVLHHLNPIEIIFTCGYGATSASVPAAIRSAILLIVSDMYENRTDMTDRAVNYSGAINSLLTSFRDWTFII